MFIVNLKRLIGPPVKLNSTLDKLHFPLVCERQDGGEETL